MRWVAIVLVALLLLAVWAAGLLIPDLRWIAEAVTALVVVVILLILLVRWVRARMKAASLERELTKTATPAEAAKRPEVVALEAEMRAAVEALKKKRGPKGKGGGAMALYKLPWYVIVGPPAAGKTTAFAQSGLTFVGAEAGAPKVRGSAGTRNCDWWFSDEAILLDTAGRFATQREDQDEWMAFLATLQRVRPDRPLDGLIVAVSVPEILSASDHEREHLAAQLRARLNEVLDRLEIVLPVYLLLTKADLIPGFVEFWSALPKPQRSQVWGASFNVDDPRLTEPARAIQGELDALTEGLHTRLLQRLPQERSPERRTRIMQFPVELEALRMPLGQFVEALCRPNEANDTPLLRGFYLTSGTQMGRPVDRVLAGMLRGFGSPNLAMAPPAGEAQSYFLTDVFRSVILPDRNLAARSAAGTERRSKRELRTALIGLGITAFIMVPAIVSYVHNTSLKGDVDAATGALRSVGATSVPGTPDDPIEPMASALDRLDRESTGFAMPAFLIPRAAAELREPLRAAYVARIHASLRALVGPELRRSLDEAARARNLPDPVNLAQNATPRRIAYDTLRMYATLADPKGHVDADAAAQLAALWKKTIEAKGGAKALDDARLQKHAATYLAALENDANAAMRWPAEPMKDVRKNLRELNREASQLPYHYVLRAAYDVPPLLAGDVFDQASLRYVDCKGGVLMDGTYTKNGWLKVRAVLDAPLPKSARIEPWVLEDSRVPADDVALRQQIRKQYFDDYSTSWMGVPPPPTRSPSFLERCVVMPQPADSPPTFVQSKLTALKGPEGFYRRLFAQFKDNDIADEPKKNEILGITIPTATEGCGSKVPGMPARPAASGAPQVEDTPVQTRFKPFLVFSGDEKSEKATAEVPLDKYLSELDNVTVMLDAAAAGTKPGEAAPDQDSRFSTTKHAIETLLIGSFVEPTRAKVWKLLMAPIETTKAVVHHLDDSGVGKDWKSGVWTFWHDQLSDKWPFNKRAADAATFQDFETFFKPGTGLLWDFAAKSLKDRVELKGNKYAAVANADVPLRADVIPCLNVAKEISDTFFAVDGEKGFKFGVFVDWTASDVAEPKFLIDAKATPLVKEQWGQVMWSGETEVSLEWTEGGRKQSASGHRAFALFNLFKTLGGLKPTDATGIYVSQFPPLTIKFRSVGGNDAFRADFFSKLSCPDALSEAAP